MVEDIDLLKKIESNLFSQDKLHLLMMYFFLSIFQHQHKHF